MTDRTVEQFYAAVEEFREGVSVEGLSIEQLRQFVVNRAPRISSALADTFRTLSTWDHSQPEVLNVRSIRGVMRKVEFSDLEEFLMMKPVGFNARTGSLLDYAQHFQKFQLPLMTRMEGEVLRSIERVLGGFLSDPKALEERLRPHQGLVMDNKPIKTSLELEGRWVVSGNRTHEDVYPRLFYNVRSFSETAQVINEVNTTRWQDANPKAIAKQAEVVGDIADRLMQEIKRGEYTPQKANLLLIADILEHAARWVEWYAGLVTRISDFTAAMKTNERKIMRAL